MRMRKVLRSWSPTARGLPYRIVAERQELRYHAREALVVAGKNEIDLRADGEVLKPVLADIEREPRLRRGLDRQHRLTGL